MSYAYPCRIVPDEDGALVVTFPDVPEAITGAQDRAEALRLAADALRGALAGYVLDERAIPQPSTASTDEELVAVPAVTTAKLALYSAMRSQGITNSDLARKLRIRPSAVQTLTDPDSRSRIGPLQDALDAVGCQLAIDINAA